MAQDVASEAFPGRCCADPSVEYVGWLGHGWAGDCVRPTFVFCVHCGADGFARCLSTRASQCGTCASRHRRRVEQVVRDGLVRSGDGLCLTVTAPGDGPHCRRPGKAHRRCFGRGAGCDPCPCGTEDGVDLAQFNRDFTANMNRVREGIKRGEASPKVRGHRASVPLAYFSGREVQKRGALHSHEPMVRTDGRPLQLDKSLLRGLLIRHGFGHSMTLKRTTKAGPEPVYVSKYVSKAADQREAVPWGVDSTGRRRKATYRAWSSSRSWPSSMKEVKAEALAKWLAAADPTVPAPPAPLDASSGSYADVEGGGDLEGAFAPLRKLFDGSPAPPTRDRCVVTLVPVAEFVG